MGSYESNTLPYWQVNIPEQDRTAECPDFLKNLTDKDRGIIGTPDAEYRLQTWEDVCRFVSTNRLELFQRRPSDLRRYKAFTYNLAKRYGSVANFILSQRLGWEAPLQPKGKPFQEPSDIKILMNDWPYGIEPRVTHLVVWVKFALEEDPATGDLTDQARAEIESFVTKTFCQHVPRSQLIWFKNWAGLKSVHAVEHFHVMLLDAEPSFIKEVTNGDVAQCNRPELDMS